LNDVISKSQGASELTALRWDGLVSILNIRCHTAPLILVVVVAVVEGGILEATLAHHRGIYATP
jgi:hypothetical protein